MLTYTFTAIKKSVNQILVAIVPWPVDELSLVMVKLAHSREANGFPRDSFILHVRPKGKYNDKMIDILYLNSHWMENDRFTAINMYMHVGLMFR